MTVFPMFKFLYFSVNDSSQHTRSIWDYGGIRLSENKKDYGPYSLEMYLCTDDENGKNVKIFSRNTNPLRFQNLKGFFLFEYPFLIITL